MSIWSKLLIFAAGAVVGGVTSGLFLKKKYEKKADEEISQMRQYYDGKEKEEPAAEESTEENDIPSYESEHIESPEDKEKHKNPVPAQPVDYTSCYNYEEMEHPEDDIVDNGASITNSYQESSKNPPKLIKMSEFGEEPNYETATLLYYMDNGVLTTESDEVIGAKDLDEISSIVGDVLKKYRFDTNNWDRIYVRNFARACDYEIVKVFGAFEE